MTLGTVVEGKAHLSTVFYVTNDFKNLYFKSRTQSEHSKSLKDNPYAAVSIYTPHSNYNEKSGIQTQGKVVRVTTLEEMAKAVSLYIKAFQGSEKKFEAIPELLSEFVKSTMYRYTIEKFKVLDSKIDLHTDNYENL